MLYDQIRRLASHVMKHGRLVEVNVWEEVYRLGPIHLSIAVQDDVEYPYVMHIEHRNFVEHGAFYFS